MRRREFVGLVGGAVAWPAATRAQQPGLTVIGFLSGRSVSSDSHLVMAFRQGLNESGYIEGQNVTIEFRWAEGEFDRLTTLAADLVARQAAVIFAGGVDVRIREINAAISRIPVVFATAGDPVELGLVASLNRPGGNATAVTIFSAPLGSQRLALLREVVSPATRIVLLVNPRNATTAHSLMEVQAAANGNKVVLNASSLFARADEVIE